MKCWVVYRGDVHLGRIEVSPTDSDFPWFAGRFQPSEAFAAYRYRFEDGVVAGANYEFQRRNEDSTLQEPFGVTDQLFIEIYPDADGYRAGVR